MGHPADTEQQMLEVEALQCIYNIDEFICYKDEKSGLMHLQFYALITLPDNFTVAFKVDGKNLHEVENAIVEGKDGNNQNEHINTLEVKYLPPIELFVVLPKDYPIKSAPEFTLSCSWLSAESMTELCKKLDSLWDDNEMSEILYIWTSFLKEETLEFLKLENILCINKTLLKHDDSEQRLQNKKSKANGTPSTKSEASCSVKISDEGLPTVADVLSVNISCDNSVIEDGVTNKCIEHKEDSAKYSEVTPSTSSEGKEDDIIEMQNEKQTYSNRYFYSNGNYKRQNNRYTRNNDNYNKNERITSDRGSRFNKEGGTRHETNYRRYSNRIPKKGNCDIENQSQRGYGRFKHQYNRRFDSRDRNYNRSTSVNKTDLSDKEGGSLNQQNMSETKNKIKDIEDCIRNLQEKFDNSLITNGDNSIKSEESSSSQNSNSNVVHKIGSAGDSEFEEVSCVNLVENQSKNANKPVIKDRRVKQTMSQYYLKHLSEYLENYNKDRMQTEFGKMLFCCAICYENKLGLRCTQFKPCDHIFCKDCMRQYVQLKINEGNAYVIKCPEDKCTSDITPSQVRDVVGPEQFARYDHTLLMTSLETMSDVITCPRRACQYPATRDPEEKMAACPACLYVFCAFCKMGYHGVEPCKFKSDEKAAIVKEYLEAEGEAKQAIEQRYGKKQLNMLVEVSLSESWIVNNSQTCPHCNASIEKSGGCNKMVCWRCSTYFCWVCHTRLDPANPYKHFNDPNSRCYQQLFEGVNVDDEDEEFIVGPEEITDDEEDAFEEYQ